MKISNKILLTILAFITLSLLIFALILRFQYNRIDKSDRYWEFQHQKELRFSHISIDGGNNVYTVIERATKNSGIRYKGPYEELLHYDVKNDTLFIKFDAALTSTKELKWNRRNKLGIIVFYNDLQAIKVRNGLAEVHLDSRKLLNIKSMGLSDVTVVGTGAVIDSANFTTNSRSLLSFATLNKPLEIQSLNLIAEDTSAVRLESIISKENNIKIKQQATVTFGANNERK